MEDTLPPNHNWSYSQITKMYIGLMLLLLVMFACGNDQPVDARDETQTVDARDETETVDARIAEAQLLAAIEDMRTAYEETNRLLAEQNRLWEESLTLDTPPSVASPSAAVAPTPLPAPQGDICGRSIPMQEKLLSLYPSVDLCAMVRLGELYRIESLSLDGDMARLLGSDFASMPNLRYLELRHDRNDVKGESAVLAHDFFDELGGLQTLSMRGDFGTAMLTGIPALPDMEHLSFAVWVKFPDYEGGPVPERILPPVRLPDLPKLRILEFGVGKQGEGLIRLQIDRETFAGTPNLAIVNIGGGNCLDIAADAFEGLTQLADLGLNGSPCGAFETRSDGSLDQDDDYRTLLVMPNRAVAQQIRKRDQCSGQCVVVARDEVN